MEAYYDTVVFVFYCRSRLRVSLDWIRRCSHWCIVKSFSLPEMMLRNFCLNALMDISTTFRQWQCGGTGLRAQFSQMRVFIISEHPLHIIWNCGAINYCLILLKRARYARCISESVLLFIGATSVTLLSISTMTMMYLWPHWKCKGKRTVWS